MSRRLHSLYSRTEKAKLWFSSRFTPLGKIFCMVAGVSFIFGLNTQSTMIYQIFAVSFSSLLFSFLFTFRFRPRLHAQRSLPESCVAGTAFHYRISLFNSGKRRVNGLLYSERVGYSLPDYLAFSTAREEGEERRNFFDRKMGYYRWQWLLRLGKRLQPQMIELPMVEPGAEAEVTGSLTPLKRGAGNLTGYVFVKVDPLGLCRKEYHVPSPENIIILPKTYSMAQLKFHGSRKYHQGGITLARERGDSNEFLSLREYVHGDPIKHIDWKSTARSGNTTVKQYRDEYFSRYGLVLDSFTTLQVSDIFEEAVSIAATVMMKQDAVNSVLDLLFVGSECVTCTVGSGLASQKKMMETLASVTTCRDRNFSEMVAMVEAHSALLSGIVLVLIDWDEERRRIVDYLHTNRIPTRVIRVVQSRDDVSEEVALPVPLHVVECGKIEEGLHQI